jgi:hypothetical protein
VGFLKNAIQKAQKQLGAAAADLVGAADEWVIWRRQIVGARNPLADTAMGVDPRGLVWKTEDLLVQASVQGHSSDGKVVVHSRIVPIPGDLLIRLVGQPQTEQEAVVAARSQHLRVADTPDVRRDSTGTIIMTRILCETDQSGHYQEYGQTPRRVPPRIG